jgi:hypothetical protein
VDEDANGWIDWEAFVSLYQRCRKDRTGNEPTRLYNLIEFMICDKVPADPLSVGDPRVGLRERRPSAVALWGLGAAWRFPPERAGQP